MTELEIATKTNKIIDNLDLIALDLSEISKLKITIACAVIQADAIEKSNIKKGML